LTVSVIDAVAPDRYKELGLSRNFLLDLWKKMFLIRCFEEKVEELYLTKKVLSGPAHLYIGEESIAAGGMAALGKEDVIVSHYRGHGHALARGVPPKLIMAELFGKETGTCKGVGGSMHSPKYPELNMMYATAIVGSGIPIAAGMGLAIKLRGEDRAVVGFFGDGGANIGDFHEGINMASIWKLPVVFICENNQYAVSMKASDASAGGGIGRRADAYGIPGMIVNGNDAVSVYLATKQAVERAKAGEGPTLMECKTYRIKGHGVYDVAQYRPKDEIESWKARDPLNSFRDTLAREGVGDEVLRTIDDDIKQQIEEAVKFAESSPRLKLDDLPGLVYG
jgi:TPP-dependent pyruvate/acetoin dehydrogenase alpha subunit